MPMRCKLCHNDNHTAFYCRLKKRKPIPVRQGIHGAGKIYKQWNRTKDTWFRKNPPDAQGLYHCYLRISPLCPGRMEPKYTTLDHMKSRSRHPELRFNLDNLAPACWWCNSQKGSKDIDEVK